MDSTNLACAPPSYPTRLLAPGIAVDIRAFSAGAGGKYFSLIEDS